MSCKTLCSDAVMHNAWWPLTVLCMKMQQSAGKESAVLLALLCIFIHTFAEHLAWRITETLDIKQHYLEL